MGQGACFVFGLHESAAADLHVQYQTTQTRGQLLGEDRRGDEIERVDRRRHVPHRIEAPVGRSYIRRRADDGTAGLLHDASEFCLIGLHIDAGYGFELIERAACVAQPPARDHRHIGSAGRKCRGEHQRYTIAHPTSGVLVEHRSIKLPVEYLSAVTHGQCQRHPTRIAQTITADPHSESAGLRIAHATVGKPSCHPCYVVLRQWLPMTQTREDGPCVHPSLPIWSRPKAPGSSSASVTCSSAPATVAMVTETSPPPNSASFWRQPPQGETGLSPPEMT